MLRLTPADRGTYLYLRGKGILKDEEVQKVPIRNGSTLVCCADGDQFDDLYANLAGMCLQKMPWPRIHTLTCHGGALIIPSDSPLNKGFRGVNMIEDIVDAWSIKGTEMVALYAHAPCGAATKIGMSLAQILDNLVRAKLELKQALAKAGANTKVVCLVHIDRGEGEGKRTYFLSVAEWQLLTKHNPIAPGRLWPPQLQKAAP